MTQYFDACKILTQHILAHVEKHYLILKILTQYFDVWEIMTQYFDVWKILTHYLGLPNFPHPHTHRPATHGGPSPLFGRGQW